MQDQIPHTRGFILALTGLCLSSSLWADISGNVFKDYNNNGLQDDNRGAAYAVPVTASCDDGLTYQTVTDVDGNYTLSVPASAAKCRVDVQADAIGMSGGMQTSSGSSMPLVATVINGTTDHNVSLSSSASYCQANPSVAATATPGAYTDNKGLYGGGTMPSPDLGTVFKTPVPNGIDNYRDNTVRAHRTKIATQEQTGAIWGEAYQRETNKLFVSAVLKRHVPLHDESSSVAAKASAGAIYILDANASDENNSNIQLFTTVSNVLSNQAATDLSNRNYAYHEDNKTVFYTAREGLGDLDISEDGKTLYTINLLTKELVKIDIATKNTTVTAIPNPYNTNPNPNNNSVVCANNMVRPWAVKVRGDDVYIGSVCENQVENGLGSAIQKYNGSNFTTVAVTNTLRYARSPRANIHTPDKSYGRPQYFLNWRDDNWTNSFNEKIPGGAPVLTDIEFTNKGDMVLAYISRSTYNRFFDLGSDIRKMCLNSDSSYTDEDSAAAPTDCKGTVVTYDSGGVTQSYYEFYKGDFFKEYNANDTDGDSVATQAHPEVSNGALAQIPGSDTMIIGTVDATNFRQAGGIILLSEDDGARLGARGLITANSTTATGTGNNAPGEREIYGSKSGGLGDVEMLCDPAPIEIGNYVWLDSDGDGIQDPDEAPIANVTVKLVDSGGIVVGTATTDTNGHYYFGGVANTNMNGGNPLQTNTHYQLRVSLTDPNLPSDTIVTAQDANGNTDDQHDSDGDNGVLNAGYSTITVQTTTSNDHSLDFGFTKAAIGDRVWYDNNYNGIQDPGEGGVANVTVKLVDNGGTVIATTTTDASGKYIFEDLDAGDYHIEFDLNSLPGGYTVVDQDQGGDDTADSDANTTTGKTISTHLDVAEHDLTWDMGIAQYSSLGDTIWNDTNHNGIQEAGESGVSGITVKLLDGNTDAVIDTTTTDASGNYSFTRLQSGNYKVQVDPNDIPSGYTFTSQDLGGDDAKDSDVDTTTGKTTTINLGAGVDDPSWDIGIFHPAPAITIEKFTNGDNADNTTGPELHIGDAVTWTYIITNTGNEALLNINLRDDQEGAITCPATTLAVDANMTCTQIGTVTALGLYANNATVTAKGKVTSTAVTDSNPSHYHVEAVSIGSVVWSDTDNDGVQDAGEPGIAGAKVKLLDGAGNPVAGVAIQTTGADGKYFFGSLPEGDYKVQVDMSGASGYVPAANQNANADDDTDNDSNIATTSGQIYTSGSVTLDGGTEPTEASGLAGTDDADNAAETSGNMTVDFGFYPLASIGDTVWYDDDADGVQDADEKGVQGVKVILLDSDGNQVSTTTTDANGHYVFADLTPGEYQVRFELKTLPDHYVVTSQDQGGDDAKDSDADTKTGATATTTLDPGENDPSWDMGIKRDLFRIDGIFQIDSQDSDEKTIGNAKVELVDENGTVIAETNTTSDGQYHFDVPEGKYKVRFHIPKDKLDDGYTFVDANGKYKVRPGGVVEAAVDVGPGIPQENLTLDAAITCGCANIESDSGDSLSGLAMLLLMLGTMLAGLLFVRRERLSI